jgi:hypothetical protein
MNTAEQVIEEVQRRSNEAPSAEVIDLAQRRQDKARKDWMRKHTRPMPPPTRPAA